MKYQDYMNLGFVRFDTNDTIEFKDSGYYGYHLDFKLSDKLSVSVPSSELDNPRLYIKKRGNDDSYHIIPITGEMVKDLIFNPSTTINYQSAC